MPKGYWIGRIDARDEAAYKDYLSVNGLAFAKYGGRFVVRGGPFDNPAGTSRARNVVIEFPDIEAARACWNSTEYQEARARQRGTAETDLIIIAGYDGPQPGDPAA